MFAAQGALKGDRIGSLGFGGMNLDPPTTLCSVP